MLIQAVNGSAPVIDPSAFVAPGAVVVGEVELGPQVTVWYGCVLRGDVNFIKIGAKTNLQDGTIVHVNHGGQGTTVGREVVVGHRVVLHDCTVGDNALIGMGAVVMDRASVGEGDLVAAGALVAPDTEIPPYSLAAGVPAKVRREVTPAELERSRIAVGRYINLGKCHQDPELDLDSLLES